MGLLLSFCRAADSGVQETAASLGVIDTRLTDVTGDSVPNESRDAPWRIGVQGSGFRVQPLDRFQGSGFRVKGEGFSPWFDFRI